MTFLEKNIARFTDILNYSIFARTISEKKGFLQKLDPRTKIICFLMMLVAINASQNLYFILVIYLMLICLAAWSGISTRYFILRVWLLLPFFTGLIAIPALFTTPGIKVFDVASLAVTDNGLRTALFLLFRVAVSVSLSVLLVLTTDWVKLVKALEKFGIPKIFVLILLVTYRYIFVLLNTAENMLLARRSRMTGRISTSTGQIWSGSVVGNLFDKAHHMSEDVYSAMRSRGFNGKVYILSDYSFKVKDWFSLIVAGVMVGWLYFIGS